MIRRRRYGLMAALAVLFIVPPLALAGSPPTEIQVGDNFFNPDSPPARSFVSGTGFHWSRAAGSTGQHNIRQDGKLFRSGNPTNGTIDYGITASAGTFHYYCEFHGSPSGGMDGVVKATPSNLGFTASSFTVQWANSSTNTGNQFDVRFRVNDGKWRIWKNNTAKFQGEFGKNGKPVTVVPGSGKTYDIEARSEKAGTSRRSGWSPKLTVVP